MVNLYIFLILILFAGTIFLLKLVSDQSSIIEEINNDNEIKDIRINNYKENFKQYNEIIKDDIVVINKLRKAIWDIKNDRW